MIIFGLLVGVLVATMYNPQAGGSSTKSLYVIANINAPVTPGIPIEAYAMQSAPTYLTYQYVQHVPNWAGGAVGIAIDSQSQTLFITYEFTNIIQLINATTFADLGTTTAPGAGDLAGIVYDHGKGLVYTVDRKTNKLYIYQWDPSTHALTLQSHVDLTHSSRAFGCALDEINDVFYVADGYNDEFDYYDTGTWAHLGTKTTTHAVIGIAVDEKNGFVYTGSWTYDHGLYKYDLATDTETAVLSDTSGTYARVNGIAVDPDQNPSRVYVTTREGSTGYRDVLIVFDSNLNELWRSGDIGEPTGLTIPRGEVAYNPLGLSKSDGLAEGQCVLPGDTLTYTISFDNSKNAFDVHNVVINDTLPAETTFVSASDGGTYAPATHTVAWDIGTLTAGAGPFSRTLVVEVKADTPQGTTITNHVKINSDETGPSWASEDTLVCVAAPAATIESCDSTGTKKDSFELSETVYVNGSGYAPSTTYDIYVVNDVTWSDSMTLPGPVPGTVTSVSSDSSGNILPTPVWSPSLTPGKYDIVVDVDGNGKYNVDIDALDDNDIQVTAGFFVIPEYAVGTILGLIGCFAALAAFRLSKGKHWHP